MGVQFRGGMGGHESPVSETVVWLTPPSLLQSLGPFDLDPCACSEPRPWPTAERHFAVGDDGLNQPWAGRVWLNPPYGPPSVINPWMEKLADHGYGTALVFARTETAMFHRTVWPKASSILFLQGRLCFHRPNGEQAVANAGAPSVLIAYGELDTLFLEQSPLPGYFQRLR